MKNKTKGSKGDIIITHINVLSQCSGFRRVNIMGLRDYVTPANVIIISSYWQTFVVWILKLMYLQHELFLQLSGAPETVRYTLNIFIRICVKITCIISNNLCKWYLLTYCMVQSPSGEANWFAASQEIPRSFIIALTSVRHLSLSCASPIQSTYPHPTSWRSILILSTHLRLGLLSGLFPSGFPTKTLYAPLSLPIRATCPAHLIVLDFITRTIFGEEYRSLSSSLCNLLHSPVTSSLLGPNNTGTCLLNFGLDVLTLILIDTCINRLRKPSVNLFTWSYLDTGHMSTLDIKGKTVPVLAWEGSGDAKRLRLPDFMTVSTRKL